MSKASHKRALKRYERAKKEYFEALKAFETEEEIRLALEYLPKFSLQNIAYYSAYYQGARLALHHMHEYYKPKERGEAAIYTHAIFELILSDIRYVEIFLSGEFEIRFRNHKTNNKGKLESVEAYFAEQVTISREVEI